MGLIRWRSGNRCITSAEVKGTEPLYMSDCDIAIMWHSDGFAIKVKICGNANFCSKEEFLIKHKFLL